MPIIVSRAWRATRALPLCKAESPDGRSRWVGMDPNAAGRLVQEAVVIIVESAPWRLQKGAAAGWKRRLRSSIQELMGRWVLSKAQLAIFTQDEYQQSLMGLQATRGHVIPASWIDEQDILTDVEAEQIWTRKLAAADLRLKILFARAPGSRQGAYQLCWKRCDN